MVSGGSGDAFGYVIGWFRSRSSRTIHVAVFGSDWEFCTCPAYIFKRNCWHVRSVVSRSGVGLVESDAFRLEEFVGRIVRYESSVPALNSLFDGYAYSTSEIFALYGEPNVGKTLLSVQDAFYFASKGINVLYIDTEGSLATALAYWKQRFERRFGQRKGEIYAAVLTSLEDLMRFLGYGVEVQLRGGKVEVSAELLKGTPRIESFCEDRKIGFVILDSVSAPIRNRFPSAQQNFPARADVTGMIYASLLRLLARGTAVLTTHHASINPADVYQIHAEIRGGIVVQYFSKRVVYMDMRRRKGMEDIRRFFLVRSPSARPWSSAAFARIDGERGFVEEKFNLDYLTDSERRLLAEGLLEEITGEPQQQQTRQRDAGRRGK